MTLGSTPQPADVVSELRSNLPYTFPDGKSRWLAEVGSSAAITFPTSFASKQAVKIEYNGYIAAGASPVTFTGVPFGDAFPERVLIACTGLYSSSGGVLNIVSGTIGGVSAVGHNNGEYGGSGPAIGAGIRAAAVPSGTSGTVVINYTGVVASYAALILLSTTGVSATPYSYDSPIPSGSGGTSISGSVTAASNGLVVGCCAKSNINTFNWTGLPIRAGLNFGGGSLNIAYDNRLTAGAKAISCSWTGTAFRGFELASYN